MGNLRPIILTGSLFFFLLSGCQYLKRGDQSSQGKEVARVYDSYLYQEDLKEVVPAELGGKDSARFVDNFIKSWAQNMLMVYKAEYNLPESQKKFQRQIEQYRNDLLKHAYLEAYTAENLDTTVSDSVILDYYQRNKENFLLKENIVKLRYLVIPEEAPHLEEIKGLFLSDDEADRAQLRDYSLSYGRSFSLRDTAWIKFARMAELVPVATFEQKAFLQENSYLELTEEGLLYLIEIVDYRLKGKRAPLSYLKNLIRNSVLNRRRLALVDQLEKNLLNDALEKGEYEKY